MKVNNLEYKQHKTQNNQTHKNNNRMLRSSSKSSIGKKSLNEKYVHDHNKLLFQKIQSTLQEASHTLCYQQFYECYVNVILSLIQKCEMQHMDTVDVQIVKRMVHKYNPNLELSVRLILLEVKTQLNMFPQQNIALLNKAKHMIIDTELEYLLPKLFLLQSKLYRTLNRKDLQTKALMKAVDFAQNFVLQYLNDKEDIRKQIAQNIVVAYFQLFKLKRQDNHKEAEQYLRRSYRATERNYGEQSEVTEILVQMLNDHKNIGKGLQKLQIPTKPPQKAVTDIMHHQIKKDTIIEGVYLWQDEKIIVQMIRTKNAEQRIISMAQYNIKLDMGKITLLKNSQWVKITQGQVSILQDEVLKALGVKQENTLTTRVGIKNISREEIIKKDSLSSSSEDPSFIQKEDFNFIRKLGRAQSAKRQLNKL